MSDTMTVRSRMASPVVTATPSTSVGELTDLLLTKNLSAAPVLEDGVLRGIVSTTDLVAELAHPADPSGAARVRVAADIMQRSVVTIAPDIAIDEAATVLMRARVHRVVVAEAGRVVGILSARDLLAHVKARPSRTTLSMLMSRVLAAVDLGASVDDAVTELSRAYVHGLIVMDGPRPVGVFTHREALRSRKLPAMLRQGPVEEVMSYETICLDEDAPARLGAAYLIAMDVRRIMVVTDRRLVGIVTALDLVATLTKPQGA